MVELQKTGIAASETAEASEKRQQLVCLLFRRNTSGEASAADCNR